MATSSLHMSDALTCSGDCGPYRDRVRVPGLASLPALYTVGCIKVGYFAVRKAWKNTTGWRALAKELL